MVIGYLILVGIAQSQSFENCYAATSCSELLEFVIPNEECAEKFTYSIDKPGCQREQNLNELGNKKPQIVSFLDQTCVSKKTPEDPNDSDYTFYSLSLKLTNKNIVVTGPERITFNCRVKNVHEIDLPR